MIPEVFAFVANTSVYDGCGAEALTKEPDIPEISISIDPKTKALPNHFSTQPAPPGSFTGDFQYLREKHPNATKVGMIYGGGAAAVLAKYRMDAMKSLGYQIVYSRQFGEGESNFTPDIVRMRKAGVNFFEGSETPPTVLARVLDAAKQQNWHPEVILSVGGYTEKLPALTSAGAADGILIPLQSALFLNKDEADVPAVKLFLDWMKKTQPDFAPDLYAFSGWTSAALFVEALEKAGDEPTRKGVMDALKDIHEFDADGLLPTTNVGDREPAECWTLATIEHGKFERVLPSEGVFTCEPTGYYHAKE
jgi:ABC-type branched-subunit amino acid transport system substrate-binding protein